MTKHPTPPLVFSAFVAGFVLWSGCADLKPDASHESNNRKVSSSNQASSEDVPDRFVIQADRFCDKESTFEFCVEERGHTEKFCNGIDVLCETEGPPAALCKKIKESDDYCLNNGGTSRFCQAMGDYCSDGPSVRPKELSIKHVQGLCDGPCKNQTDCNISSPSDYCSTITDDNEWFCDRRSRILRACDEAVNVCPNQGGPGCEAMESSGIQTSCQTVLNENGSCDSLTNFCSTSNQENLNTALVEYQISTRSRANVPKKIERKVRPKLGQDTFSDQGQGADKSPSDGVYTGLTNLDKHSTRVINSAKLEKFVNLEPDLPLEHDVSDVVQSQRKSSVPKKCEKFKIKSNDTVMWKRTDIVEDPQRTVEPCDVYTKNDQELESYIKNVDLTEKVWSFGYLMKEASGSVPTSVFIREWLNEWSVEKNFPSTYSETNPRTRIDDVISTWENQTNRVQNQISSVDKNQLIPELAPFRLLAIVNRTELASGAVRSAFEESQPGKVRLIFGYTNPTQCGNESQQEFKKFVVSLDYRLPREFVIGCPTINWAEKWHDLKSVSPSNFNSVLSDYVSEIVENTGDGTGVNDSNLVNIRTAEQYLSEDPDPAYQFREFSGLECQNAPQEDCCQGESPPPGYSTCPITTNGPGEILSLQKVSRTADHVIFESGPTNVEIEATPTVDWINNEFDPNRFNGSSAPKRARKRAIQSQKFTPNGIIANSATFDQRGGHANLSDSSPGEYWDPAYGTTINGNPAPQTILDRTPATSNADIPSMRYGLAINSCNGCHGRETGNMSPSSGNMRAFHVDPRDDGESSNLSEFLTGDPSNPGGKYEVQDPVDLDMTHKYDRLASRRGKISDLASGMCEFELVRIDTDWIH